MNDVSWHGTGGITDIQSYAWVIVNAIFERLQAWSEFSGYVVRRINAALPIEAGIHIPFIGIYEGDQTLEPEGEPNIGDIRFKHTLPIGFQIVLKNNDSEALLQNLDRASWFIMNQLLRDDSFTNLWRTDLPDNMRVQAFPRGRIRTRWGVTGQKNEIPVGERLLELSLQWISEFYPTDFDELRRIAVRAFPRGVEMTPDEPGPEKHKVTIVYDFNPDAVRHPLPPETPPPFPEDDKGA